MVGEHSHGGGALRAGARYQRRLLWAFGLIFIYFLVEVVAGLLTNSLALLSDAGHMLTDVLGLGMALAAIQLASRAGDNRQRTFGLYRLEILAALANAVLLMGVAAYVLFEAVQRLRQPPDVLGLPMLVVATVGLIINLVAFWLLRSGAEASLNVRGAYLEVIADTIGSIGVIVAAVVLAITEITWVDPLVGAGIGLFILPRTWRLGSEALRILIEASPRDIDVAAVEADLAALVGVVGVHDLHIWTLTSEMNLASGHLVRDDDVIESALLSQACALLRERYGIAHATLQVEPRGFEGCEVDW